MNKIIHGQAPKPRRETRTTYNTRRAVVAAGLLLTAFAGKGVYDNVKDYQANQAEPICEVPVHSGDTLSGIEAKIKAAGDDVRGEPVEVWTTGPDSHKRTFETDPRTFYTGSMGMQPGDNLRIEHVDPAACIDVGGTSINQALASQK